jgi:hypothetical protein
LDIGASSRGLSHADKCVSSFFVPNVTSGIFGCAGPSDCWYKALVYGHLILGIVGSNFSGVVCDCCVLSGRGLFFGLVSPQEEFYRVWCV